MIPPQNDVDRVTSMLSGREAGYGWGTIERLVTEALLKQVSVIAAACHATAILMPVDALPADCMPLQAPLGCRVIYAVRGAQRPAFDQPAWMDACFVQVPHVPLTRMSLIKVTIFLALSRGHLSIGDVVIALAGPASGGEIDTMFTTQVSHESESFQFLPNSEQVPAGVSPEVVARLVDVAIEIGAEGREGKPTGALFVLGDAKRVLDLSRPLVLNPFHGYSEEQRNILDSAIEETIKEFSTIDGAFIVRGDGVVEACGVYLKTAASGRELPHGLGARHHVAAGITAVTDSMAIAVSESTGTVTIFRSGKILTEILKAKRLDPDVVGTFGQQRLSRDGECLPHLPPLP